MDTTLTGWKSRLGTILAILGVLIKFANDWIAAGGGGTVVTHASPAAGALGMGLAGGGAALLGLGIAHKIDKLTAAVRPSVAVAVGDPDAGPGFLPRRGFVAPGLAAGGNPPPTHPAAGVAPRHRAV
jgi:hypothetical protein